MFDLHSKPKASSLRPARFLPANRYVSTIQACSILEKGVEREREEERKSGERGGNQPFSPALCLAHRKEKQKAEVTMAC